MDRGVANIFSKISNAAGKFLRNEPEMLKAKGECWSFS